ncbi:MAG TPA: sialidase family protein [Longilinea sp.]|nr:sialidase family protein [Longilinea sp.]
MNRRFFSRLITLVLAICLVAGIAGGVWLPVHAQIDMGGWSIPVNLSNSGKTVRSFITADSSGVMHAFWLDKLNGMQYSHSRTDGWSTPRKAVFPISLAVLTASNPTILLMPKLVSGPSNWVYLFWQDGNGLRYSSANTANGKTLAAWSNGGVVALNSASYDVLVDSDGVLHVAYVQPVDTNGDAGVYYVRSNNSGSSWTVPVLLYSSPYYRNLASTEITSAPVDNSVDLSVTNVDGKKAIFVAFDNQPRKRVFIAHSLDDGISWENVEEIDAPLPGAGLASPGQIHVSARSKQALLAWQVKQSDTVCFTYFRNSDDGGKTWNAGQRLYTPYSGCADQFDFLAGFEKYSMLVVSVEGLSFLNAWDGKSWTGFQHQSMLSSFIDPETQDNVSFELSDWTLKKADQLAAIGNDRGTGGDTWLMTRSLADVSTWFAGEPGWKITPDLERITGEISNLQLVSESSEVLHAFWVHKEVVIADPANLVPSEPSRVVYYSSLNENRWTDPVQILRAPSLTTQTSGNLQKDDVTDLTVASGPDDRLWALWKNSVGGEIYISWARASAANSVNEWSKPALIASIPVTASEFSMVVDRGGWIHIAYVVPVNEGRGVYLVQSRDQGRSWSNPVLAFDGQAQNWERVSSPSLTAAADGSLWVLFSRQSVSASNLAAGLYSVHSMDRGTTWSTAETVSQENILANQMLAQSNGVLHRIWLEQMDNGQALIFHQVSTDGGQTWGRVTRISDFAGSPGPIAATIDRTGQIHLTQILEDQYQHLLLRYWLWNGSRWNVQDDFDLGNGSLDAMDMVGLGISPGGQLGAMISRPWIGTDIFTPDSLLVGFNRPVTLPKIIETPLPPLPTEIVEPSPQPSETPAATSTIDLATLNQGGPSTGGGTVGGVVIALVASLLVIGGGAGIAITRARKIRGE